MIRSELIFSNGMATCESWTLAPVTMAAQCVQFTHTFFDCLSKLFLQYGLRFFLGLASLSGFATLALRFHFFLPVGRLLARFNCRGISAEVSHNMTV